MARFSFATAREAVMPENGKTNGRRSVVPTFSGFPAEASTLIAVVFVEAAMFAAMRRYFRHYNGG